jgi:RNA polymerase sigma factor, FliA/WhiG family
MKQIISTDEAARDGDIDKLWKEYKTTGSPDLKNEITMHYLWLINSIVRRMMPKYGKFNEYDDLINCGVLGLMDAVEKFDLGHGVKFEAYSALRIKGEILDYMRSQDWAPPSMRKKISAISKLYEQAENDKSIYDVDGFVAEHMEMSGEQVQKVLAQSHMFNVMSFEDSIASIQAVNSTPIDDESLPERQLMKKELKQALVETIDTLGEKERLVVTLYYYEGLLLKEIADIMGVTESRVSQIHSKVLMKLKVKLGSR